ncbi:MAG: TldD/PmbA family protein [Deltaproteobacteria bacterium]|nr:TldD/PmbA family protein [Deltaproteobacteria bacterium]
MIGNFNLKKVFDRALQGGGSFADLFFEERQLVSIACEENKIERIIAGGERGMGLRAIVGDRTVYAHSSTVTEEKALELAGRLKGVFQAQPGSAADDYRISSPGRVFSIERDPAGIGIPRKTEAVMRANERAWAYDGRIRQVKVVYADRVQRVVVANAEGRIAEETRIGTMFLVQVVAAAGNIIQTGYEPVGGIMGFELLDGDLPERVAETAARRAILMLEAEPAPGGAMPVVLSSEAGGTMIHEAVGHGLEADLAGEGLSVYTGKLGQRVAAEAITVVDDATLPSRRGSYAFDDEGTPGQRTMLIDQGILTGYMSDHLSKIRYGYPMTGNGRRESYRNHPIPRMSNTIILPGQANPDDIIAETKTGLLVKKMGGGQVNTINGDFVFEVSEGYLIENGRQGRPVRGATLTGNGPKVMLDIDLVGRDLGFSLGTCGKDGQGVPVADAQPTIRIRQLVVGGEIR